MRILLLGEYSGIHTDLAVYLRKKGHDVLTCHDGDSFKNYPREIDLNFSHSNRLIRYYKFIKTYLKLGYFIKNRKFDVIQIINPGILHRPFDKLIFHLIFSSNARKTLLACGDDDVIWDAFYKGCFRYYGFEGLLKYDKIGKGFWEKPRIRKISKYVRDSVDTIIPMCIEYKIAYEKHFSNLPFVPLSIDPLVLKFDISKKKFEKIIILHGRNRGREGVKGFYIVEEALNRIKKEFGNEIEIRVPENIAFDKYKKMLFDATIVVDQPYGYSASMNALYAMLHGCVVLSGSEKEYLDSIGVTESPIINILPDVEDIYLKLKRLILSKNILPEISKKSFLFVNKYHSIKQNVDLFIDIWQKNNNKKSIN